MAISGGWRFGAALVGMVLVTAGCGDAAGSGLALAEVTASPSACPVDLAAAATSAGMKPDGSATGHTIEGTVPAIRKIGGVVAECSLRLDGGADLSLLVVAAERGSPVPVVLPDLQARAGLATVDLAQVATTAEKAEPGDLVPLPGSAPVALLILPVSGAGDAAARLAGSDGTDRAQVEAVARAIAGGLS